MKGFIKLHRRILDWEWYTDSNVKSVFIHVLLNACYDDCRFMGKKVNRGEYMTSLSRLSSDLSIPVRQLRTSLTRLKQTGEIDMQTTNKYTKITICNYDSYQVEERAKKPKSTSKRQTVRVVNVVQDYVQKCLHDPSWTEVVCMQNNIGKTQLSKMLDVFNNHLLMTDEKKQNIRDFKSHFVNWLKYNKGSVKNDEGPYKWKWKGQLEKSGTYDMLVKDKEVFDKPGFEFKVIQNG